MSITCAAVPCKSCPYRRDVPSGVWAAEEYDKLPCYDADTADQLFNGGEAMFMCHTSAKQLCAGWVSVHAATSVALRLNYAKLDPAVFGYHSPVRLFSSGTQAALHGKRALNRPGPRARRIQKTILKKRKRKLTSDVKSERTS